MGMRRIARPKLTRANTPKVTSFETPFLSRQRRLYTLPIYVTRRETLILWSISPTYRVNLFRQMVFKPCSPYPFVSGWHPWSRCSNRRLGFGRGSREPQAWLRRRSTIQPCSSQTHKHQLLSEVCPRRPTCSHRAEWRQEPKRSASTQQQGDWKPAREWRRWRRIRCLSEVSRPDKWGREHPWIPGRTRTRMWTQLLWDRQILLLQLERTIHRRSRMAEVLRRRWARRHRTRRKRRRGMCCREWIRGYHRQSWADHQRSNMRRWRSNVSPLFF